MTFRNVIILIKSVWNKDKNKYYYGINFRQSFIWITWKIISCIKYKYYIMMELTFMKELISTKQMHQKSVVFVTISIFLDKGFKFQTYICNRCHDLLMMSMNLSDIVILNIKNVDYCCVITGISKMKLKSYCKILIWLKKVEHYKTINIKSNFEAKNLLRILT